LAPACYSHQNSFVKRHLLTKSPQLCRCWNRRENCNFNVMSVRDGNFFGLVLESFPNNYFCAGIVAQASRKPKWKSGKNYRFSLEVFLRSTFSIVVFGVFFRIIFSLLVRSCHLYSHYYSEKSEINCPLRLYWHAKHTFAASKRTFSHNKCTYVSTFADAGLCRV
jgi:hypothetical protein